MVVIPEGLDVVVYAAHWLNKRLRGRWTYPIYASIISVNMTSRTVVVRAKYDRYIFGYRLRDKTLPFSEVYVLDYWERGYAVDLNYYLRILEQQSGGTGGGSGGTGSGGDGSGEEETECKCKEEYESLERRVKLLEKKLKSLNDHVQDKYVTATSISPNDL